MITSRIFTKALNEIRGACDSKVGRRGKGGFEGKISLVKSFCRPKSFQSGSPHPLSDIR